MFELVAGKPNLPIADRDRRGNNYRRDRCRYGRQSFPEEHQLSFGFGRKVTASLGRRFGVQNENI
jgi:hypothetical protein